MPREEYLFTSESVSEGHPDKICDQISDLVLDLYLARDPNARVACEALITENRLVVAGEVRSQEEIPKETLYKEIVALIERIGYTSEEEGFDPKKADILIDLHEQSPDIAMGVDKEDQGAGDQGLMFGFAIKEAPTLMPYPIYYAHRLLEKLSNLRKQKKLPFLRPDAKSQVTVLYKNGKIAKIPKIVLSTQHTEDISLKDLKEAVIEECIKKVIPEEYLQETEYFINPTGRFVIGGPKGDTGLTGRKIIVDTYGGYARHGGGAFSGKDPSKVDRSASYMARFLAKNIVSAGLATRVEVQIAYAIGVSKPLSLYVDTFGTGKIEEEKIEALIQEKVDLRPKAIEKKLRLREISYLPTATYGHFGREGEDFTWEKIEKGIF